MHSRVRKALKHHGLTVHGSSVVEADLIEAVLASIREASAYDLGREGPVRIGDTTYDRAQAQYHVRRDDGTYVQIYLDGMADPGDSQRMLTDLTAEAARLRSAGHTVV